MKTATMYVTAAVTDEGPNALPLMPGDAWPRTIEVREGEGVLLSFDVPKGWPIETYILDVHRSVQV